MILCLPFLIKLECKLENRSSWRKAGKRKEPTTKTITYGVDTGISTRATLMKSECSYHYTNLASNSLKRQWRNPLQLARKDRDREALLEK